jgi:anaerobic ribonucleoside-triphosphate reductase activating protein
MNIAHIHPNSDIYGPGQRFVIWTQGCSIRCPGCWNTEFWDFKAVQEVPPETLVEQALAVAGQAEGITVLGGEPFDQYDDLLELARLLADTGLSLMLYTGYTLAQLEEAGKTAVLQWTDILVEGPYVHALRDQQLRWRGSSNQVLHFLGPRYADLEPWEARQMELLIHADGSMTAYGYPDSDFLPPGSQRRRIQNA